MRVKIRDVLYDSVKDAAAHLGVSTSHVYKMVNEGRQDIIGIGGGRRSKGAIDRFEGNRVNLFGVEFRSMTEASAALGFKPHYVRGVLVRQGVKGMTRIREAVALYLAKKEDQGL